MHQSYFPLKIPNLIMFDVFINRKPPNIIVSRKIETLYNTLCLTTFSNVSPVFHTYYYYIKMNGILKGAKCPILGKIPLMK